MHGSTMHEQFLLAALNQARLGRGLCAPNPSVGAVAVLNGVIIAQSWHHGAGTPHAEALVLDKLPIDCSDITLYVTLEPCNHWGRTSPCVDAIIHRGIKHVVYGYTDPNPVVCANNTPVLLSQHNIIAQHYPLPEIDDFYQSYRYWTLTHKPWVTVKMAQTFDGNIAGPLGKRILLSNELCAQFTHQNRKNSDIILTTARTVHQDDPLFTVRLPGEVSGKPIAIIDAQLTLKPDAKLFTHAKVCHIYYDSSGVHDPERVLLRTNASQKNNNSVFHPMLSQSGKLDLHAVIHHLGTLGYHDVWVEAGAGLFQALHQAGLVNRTYIYLVPKILGQCATKLYADKDIFNNVSKVTWLPMGDNVIAQFDWLDETNSIL